MDSMYSFTSGDIFAAVMIAAMLLTLVMLAISGIYEVYKLERGDEDVRHRPAKQNSDI